MYNVKELMEKEPVKDLFGVGKIDTTKIFEDADIKVKDFVFMSKYGYSKKHDDLAFAGLLEVVEKMSKEYQLIFKCAIANLATKENISIDLFSNQDYIDILYLANRGLFDKYYDLTKLILTEIDNGKYESREDTMSGIVSMAVEQFNKKPKDLIKEISKSLARLTHQSYNSVNSAVSMIVIEAELIEGKLTVLKPSPEIAQ